MDDCDPKEYRFHQRSETAHENTAIAEDGNEGKSIDSLCECETDLVSFINIYKLIRKKERKYTSTNEAHQNTITKACISKNIRRKRRAAVVYRKLH